MISYRNGQLSCTLRLYDTLKHKNHQEFNANIKLRGPSLSFLVEISGWISKHLLILNLKKTYFQIRFTSRNDFFFMKSLNYESITVKNVPMALFYNSQPSFFWLRLGCFYQQIKVSNSILEFSLIMNQ